MTVTRRAKERFVSIYAKSVAEALRRNLSRSPTAVMVFSPYLTSGTAERVVGACCVETSEVYTVFTTEQFATGASSIRTVIKLLEQGYQVFHIPDLHAKVTLASDFASVGSQNLTARGTKNREVTALITDAGAVADLREGVAPWLELRQPVTLEMARDMERRVGLLAKEWRKLKAQFDEADQAITEAEDGRRAARARRDQNLRSFEAAVNTCPASDAIRVRTTHLPIPDARPLPFGLSLDKTYETLKATRGANLLEWVLDGHPLSLEHRLRYLIVDASRGRLGWVRFNRGQLTDFATGFKRDGWQFGGDVYQVSLEAPVPSDDAPSNLVATVIPPGRSGAIKIQAFLGLDGIDIHSVEVGENDWGAEDVADKMRRNPMALKDALLDVILSPFEFLQRKREGSRAGDFLKRRGSFVISIRQANGQPFCCIEPA